MHVKLVGFNRYNHTDTDMESVDHTDTDTIIERTKLFFNDMDTERKNSFLIDNM